MSKIWWIVNDVILALLLACLAFCCLVGCDSPWKTSGGSERKEMRQTVDRKSDMRVDLDGPELPSKSELVAPSSVKVTKDGITASIPPGVKASFQVGDELETRESSSSRTLIDRVKAMPWYVYGIGAAVIAGSLLAGWLLKSVVIAAAGAAAGLLWCTIFVLVESYRWVFLLAGGAGILGLCAMAYYIWWAKKDEVVIEELARAIEGAGDDVKAVLKGLQKSAPKKYEAIKATISRVKREKGIQADNP